MARKYNSDLGKSKWTPAQAEKMFIGRLRELGYSEHAIAAIAGHAKHESRGWHSAATLKSNDGKDDSYGLLQWNKDRNTALHAYAKSVKRDPADPALQADFFHKEANSSEGTTGKALKNAKTADEAAEAMVHFERPRGYVAYKNAKTPKAKAAALKNLAGWKDRQANARAYASKMPKTANIQPAVGGKPPSSDDVEFNTEAATAGNVPGPDDATFNPDAVNAGSLPATHSGTPPATAAPSVSEVPGATPRLPTDSGTPNGIVEAATRLPTDSGIPNGLPVVPPRLPTDSGTPNGANPAPAMQPDTPVVPDTPAEEEGGFFSKLLSGSGTPRNNMGRGAMAGGGQGSFNSTLKAPMQQQQQPVAQEVSSSNQAAKVGTQPATAANATLPAPQQPIPQGIRDPRIGTQPAPMPPASAMTPQAGFNPEMPTPIPQGIRDPRIFDPEMVMRPNPRGGRPQVADAPVQVEESAFVSRGPQGPRFDAPAPAPMPPAPMAQRGPMDNGNPNGLHAMSPDVAGPSIMRPGNPAPAPMPPAPMAQRGPMDNPFPNADGPHAMSPDVAPMPRPVAGPPPPVPMPPVPPRGPMDNGNPNGMHAMSPAVAGPSDIRSSMMGKLAPPPSAPPVAATPGAQVGQSGMLSGMSGMKAGGK